LNNLIDVPLNVEVVIPTLNEEKTVGSIIERSFLYADRILVIDGRSEDKTVEIAKNLGAKVIFVIDGRSEDKTVEIAKNLGAKVIFQKGKGKGDALTDAIGFVDSDIIVILDGDGSMRPEEIPLFLKEIYSGADMVKGSRLITGGGSDDFSLIRRFGNTCFVFLVNIIFNANFTDLCYGFMAFKKHAIKKLHPILTSKGFSIETEIIIKAKKIGLKIVEVPSFEHSRLFGKSKLNAIRDGLKILSTILREATS
jgi:glycosyltransferase involved in cell wall biosynthesis